jgi:hypothetical protein
MNGWPKAIWVYFTFAVVSVPAVGVPSYLRSRRTGE